MTFVLLCGYHPFDIYGDLPEPQLLKAISSCKFDFTDPLWNGISRDPQALICGLLKLEPTERISLHEYLSSPWVARGVGASDSTQQLLISRIDRLRQSQLALRAIVIAKLVGRKFRESVSRSREVSRTRADSPSSTSPQNLLHASSSKGFHSDGEDTLSPYRNDSPDSVLQPSPRLSPKLAPRGAPTLVPTLTASPKITPFSVTNSPKSTRRSAVHAMIELPDSIPVPPISVFDEEDLEGGEHSPNSLNLQRYHADSSPRQHSSRARASTYADVRTSLTSTSQLQSPTPVSSTSVSPLGHSGGGASGGSHRSSYNHQSVTLQETASTQDLMLSITSRHSLAMRAPEPLSFSASSSAIEPSHRKQSLMEIAAATSPSERMFPSSINEASGPMSLSSSSHIGF